jgi:acetyltransferase
VRPHPLDRVFAPRAIAVLGAEDDDSVGGRVLRNVLAGGFRGAVHAIHPRRDSIAGVPCLRSLAELAGVVDLAVVATPLEEAAGIVRALGERGAAGAILPLRVAPAARRDGSAEASVRAVLAEAARHGVRLVGPNSLGLIRPAARLQATFGPGGARPGSVALVSQSAAICATMLDWAEAHRIGFSAVTSLGDAMDVDAGEILEYLALDEQTRSILLYVERIRSARAFLSGLRVAARAKPVVVVKAGRHAREDHPGAPAASDDAFDAALARAGAVRVLSVEQMFGAAQLLEAGRRVAGNRLAIVTNARGPGVLAADRALDLALALPGLGDATRSALAERLPEVGAPGNPLDLLGDAGPARYQAALESCISDPAVDGVLAMLAPQPFARPLESAEAVIAAARGSAKPILACWMGEEAVRPARSRFAEAGVPELATPERAVEAFGHLATYRRNQQLLRLVPGPIAPKVMPHTDLAREVVAAALARGRGWLTSEEVRRLLSAIGIRPEAPIRAQSRGTELHVDVARDGIFGPVIRFGLGVAAAGPAGARIVALPPLNTALIETLIQTSPVAGAFAEVGGIPAAEREAIERTLWALSEIVCEIPEITEVQLHPVVARGSLAWAAGARVAVARADPSAGRYGHMAIHPYPSDVGARWKLADGAVVTVRPIRPEDAEMEASFVRNLSLDTRHMRFMVGLSDLPPEVLFRFTQIDYDRELALVAVVERGGEEVEIAVARYMTAGDGRSADVAIVVADAWQGRGIGARLFGLLVDTARARGLHRLAGETLAENTAAIALVTRFGFTTHRDPDDASLLLLEKILV